MDGDVGLTGAILQMAGGVYLTFFDSFVFGTPGFALSNASRRSVRPAGWWRR
jgi:hypothetical protein